jgi:alpha-glucosidase
MGSVGEVLVTARRRDQTWYLGAMAAKRRRDLELPLSFLGSQQYMAKIWKDAPDSETNPNRLTTETFSAASSDKLRVQVAVDGGFVAQLSPAEK